jgi:hypothetical protein
MALATQGAEKDCGWRPAPEKISQDLIASNKS